MNSRTRRIYSLLSVALLASCGAVGERRETTIQRQWPASSIRHLEVREIDGTINVTASDTNDVSMTANVVSHGMPPKQAENEGYFRTDLEGDTLTIGREENHRHFNFFFDTDRLRIDYTLKVPPAVNVDLHTVNGRINVSGMAGESNLITVNGRINAAVAGTNELTAKTVNGRVEARFTNNFTGARLKTVNGAITAYIPTSASFYGDFSQVNGDFEASFPLNIHSNPGSRRVSGEVNGGKYELRIATVNGDIHVENGGGPAAPAAAASQTPPSPPAPPAPPAPPHE